MANRTFTITQSGTSRSFTANTGIGPAGPNNISTSTTTDITGLLKGDGANVEQAVAGTDFVGLSSSNNISGANTFTGTVTLNEGGTLSVAGSLVISGYVSFSGVGKSEMLTALHTGYASLAAANAAIGAIGVCFYNEATARVEVTTATS